MKHLKHILAVLLYVATLCIAGVSLLNCYPIAGMAEKLLQQQLGTQVEVGNVHIGLGDITLSDLKVLDANGNEALAAGELAGYVDIRALLSGRIVIRSARLSDANILVYHCADSVLNVTPIIDKLKGSGNDFGPQIAIQDVVLSHCSLTWASSENFKSAVFNTPLKNGNVQLYDINAHLLLDTSRKDTTEIQCQQMSFSEASGVDVKDMRFNLAVMPEKTLLRNAKLRLPSSSLAFEAVKTQDVWTGSLSGYFDSKDVQSLVPELQHVGSMNIHEVSVRYSPTLLTLNRVDIDGNEMSLKANGTLQLADAGRKSMQIDKLSVSSNALKSMTGALGGSVELPQQLFKLGNLDFSGSLLTDDNAVNIDGTLATALGKIEQLHFTTASGLQISAETSGFALSRLIETVPVDLLSGKVSVSDNGKEQYHVDAALSQLRSGSTLLHNVNIDGVAGSSGFSGSISVNDPNLVMDSKADVHTHGKTLSVQNLQAQLRQTDLSALGITNRWSGKRFNMDLSSSFSITGNNLETAHVDISDISVQDQDGFISYFPDMQLVSEQIAGGYSHSRFISQWADFDLKGLYSYSTLLESFTDILADKLPTLPGLSRSLKVHNNQLELQGEIRNADLIKYLFDLPVELNKSVSFSGSIDDLSHNTRLNIIAPDFLYNDKHYVDGIVSLWEPNDTLRSLISLRRLQGNAIESEWNIEASAASNRLSTRMHFNTHGDKHMAGELNSETNFFENQNGQATAHMRILPSDIIIEDSLWSVMPAEITYYKQHLDIKNLEIAHNAQHVRLNGCASDQSSDSLVIDINDVDVAYAMDLIDFHSVAFGGRATGKAILSNVFNKPDANGILNVRDFTFEDGNMGVLYATARLNNELHQIDIDGYTHKDPFHRMLVKGFVAPERNDILLDITAQQAPADFLNKICSSFMQHVEMTVNGYVSLVGPLNDIDLRGALEANGYFNMKPLGVDYYLKSDTVLFTPHAIVFNSNTLYDKDDHAAYVNGRITHKNLGSMHYDISMELDKCRVYEFPEVGNFTFAGNVSASGNCHIGGSNRDMVIDMNITPEPRSVFTYNASTPDALTESDFIVWHDRDTYASASLSEPSAQELTSNQQDILLQSVANNLHVNFLINVNPNATLKVIMDNESGDYIALNGSGALRASYYNNGPFNMYGNYVVNHGIYKLTIQNIIKKDFKFMDGGTISFGGEPYDAALNLQAQYAVNGVSLSDLNIGKSFSSNNIHVDCLMNITGTPNEPKVSFGIDFPTLGDDARKMVHSIINSQEEMNQQVLYLLTIGRFYSQGNNNAEVEAENQQSQTSLAMQSLLSGTISQQINNVLSSVVNNANWNFGANISTGNEGWNNAEYEGILSGRMLNNRLLFNGQFGYRDNANATTSFIGDFDLKYLLTPNGNLAVNVYNETSDRYFTKNSLTTQGLGLVMKKDFSGWRDLLGVKKKAQRDTLYKQRDTLYLQRDTLRLQSDTLYK